MISGFVFLYKGIGWWRMRKAAPKVIAKIRSRKTDPEVPRTT
jgi:hypothetical protein